MMKMKKRRTNMWDYEISMDERKGIRVDGGGKGREKDKCGR